MEFLKKMNPVFVSVIAFCALFGLTLSLFLNPIKEDIKNIEGDIQKLEVKMEKLEVKMEGDIQKLEVKMETSIQEVRKELKADIADVKRDFNTRMDRMESKIDLLLMDRQQGRGPAQQNAP